jgi:hypothetical protein
MAKQKRKKKFTLCMAVMAPMYARIDLIADESATQEQLEEAAQEEIAKGLHTFEPAEGVDLRDAYVISFVREIDTHET